MFVLFDYKICLKVSGFDPKNSFVGIQIWPKIQSKTSNLMENPNTKTKTKWSFLLHSFYFSFVLCQGIRGSFPWNTGLVVDFKSLTLSQTLCKDLSVWVHHRRWCATFILSALIWWPDPPKGFSPPFLFYFHLLHFSKIFILDHAREDKTRREFCYK